MLVAQTTANAQYSAPVYSGGKVTTSSTTSSATTYPYGVTTTPFGGWGGGGPNTASCTGAITATFTWDDFGTGAAPQNVIVEQQSYAYWQAENLPYSPSGSVDDGLGDGEVDTEITQVPNVLYLYSGVSKGTTYMSEQPASDGTVTLTCTPSASVKQSGASEAYVDYSASVVPVSITLNGPINVNGTYEILPGQICNATLQLPAGYTCSKCDWTISGTYYGDWDYTIPQSSPPDKLDPSALNFNYPPPYVSKSTTGNWYWDDTKQSTPETVSCTATVNAPDGTQFTATFSTKVSEVVPTSNMTAMIGSSGIYPNAYGTSDYWLVLDGANNTEGYILDYTVTQSTDFQGVGECAIAQLLLGTYSITPPLYSWSEDGLDGGFPYPYGGSGPTNGVINTMMDSPGIDCKQFTSVTINDSFTDYLMYLPPNDSVGPSLWVPLKQQPWYWYVTATEPTGDWANTSGVKITGIGPGTGTECPTNDYPEWDNYYPA